MALPLRFGVIADIQNADKDNTYFEGRTRYHRQVPAKLAAAADGLLAAHASAPLAAVVSLGDLIDGYPGQPHNAERSRADLDAVLRELRRVEDAVGVRVRHAIGNHDHNIPRGELSAVLGLAGPAAANAAYHSVPLAPGWRLLVLDTTDISVHDGRPLGSAEAAQARAELVRLTAAGAPNALDWNGAASAHQLAWLRAELAAAVAAGERVVAVAHHPLLVGSAPAHYLAWNAADIVAAFDAHPGAVALVLTGHFHAGGAAEANGTHYVTLEGLVESPPGSTSYAVVEVASGKISVIPGGYATARELPLAAAPAPAPASESVAPAAPVPFAALATESGAAAA